MSQRTPTSQVPPAISRSRSSIQARPSNAPIPAPPLPAPFEAFLASLPPPQEWLSILLDKFIYSPINSLLDSITRLITSPRTHRVVLRLGVLGAIFYSSLIIALAAYVGFYRAWVPHVGVRKNVDLQYGLPEPPFADLIFSPFDVNSSSTTTGGGGFFADDQEYDVSLELTVPLSAANLDLGNFMVSLDLRSETDQLLHRASKPTILIYEPAPIRQLSYLSSILSRNPPDLRDSLSTSGLPSQLLSISLLKRSILSPSPRPFSTKEEFRNRRVTKGRVTVGRKDSELYWKYGGGHGVGGIEGARAIDFRSRGELQTLNASLRFDAHLTGLRYLMYHHPLFSFISFTALFLALELFIAFTLWALAALYTSSLSPGFSLETEDNYLGSRREDDGRSGAGRRARRGGRNVFDSTEDDEGETTATQGRNGTTATGTTESGTETATILSGDELDDEEESGERRTRVGAGGDSREERERASRLSLLARDLQERNESRRSREERDLLQGRRMMNVDMDPLELERYEMERNLDLRREREINRELGLSGTGGDNIPSGSGSGRGTGSSSSSNPTGSNQDRDRDREIEMPSATRVLGRLDEETEEETEPPGSRRSSFSLGAGGGNGNNNELDQHWEDIGSSSPAIAESMRRRRNVPTTSENKPGESTFGGSSTSRASSIRSFGATTQASRTTGSSSNLTAGPSGTASQSPTSPSIQDLMEEGDEGDNEMERGSQNTTDTPSEETPENETQSLGETSDEILE